MAINIDHTNSANITLRGPSQASSTDFINFVFPNTIQTEANLLISGDAGISAIQGLADALDAKVSNSATGSAALVNTGVAAGEIPVLDQDGKLSESLIPGVAIKDVYEVSSQNDLTSLTNARIGDLGIDIVGNKNYVLSTNDYATLSDWKEIIFPQQAVTSVNGFTGAIALTANDIYATIGASYDTTQNHINSLFTNKLDATCLTNYATTTDVTNCLGGYVTDTDLSNCLSCYVTSAQYSSDLSCYITAGSVDTCLSNYALSSQTGSAASLSAGTSAGNVVVVNGDGKIDNSIVPHIAITDVFVSACVSDLYGCSAVQKGDVIIATSESKTYILCGECYSNPLDYTALAVTAGAINCVNGLTPVNGSINLWTCDIPVCNTSTPYDGLTFSDALTGLYDRISVISGDYVTTQEATDLLTGYETITNVTNCLGLKADSAHTHVVADVSGLAECLASTSTFFTGAGAYSATQNGTNPGMNEALGCYSVALGYGAKAIQDYEIAHAASFFNNVGDAQSSRIVMKGTTNTCDFAEVATLTIDSANVLFFKADMVGYGTSSAAFRIEGAANSSALLNNISVTTFADSNEAINVDAVHCGSYVSFQASGENAMNWVTSLQTVKIK
jgi:hypothetical protein